MDSNELAVMLDSQGVSYLRLSGAASGNTVLLLNNGKTVDLIKMDKATIKGRDLQVVHNANVLDAVKTLLHPLNPNVKVSRSAELELTKILNDKELVQRMTPAKVAVAPAATTTKAPKPVKVGTGRGPKPAAAKAAKAPKPAKAKVEKANRAQRNEELDNTTVVATEKATSAREGSLWHQIGQLASKPIKLGALVNKVAAKPVGIRSEKLSGDADALAASIRIRVRDAYSRLGFLKQA